MEAIIDRLIALLAQRDPHILHIGGVPHLVVPNDMSAKALPELLERENPAFIRRDYSAYDVRGFVDYINEYKGAEATPSRIYSKPPEGPGLTCNLVDHQPDQPEHITHRAWFGCPTTKSWQAWTSKNRQPQTQLEFAEFLQDHTLDIREPTGASLLEMVLQFRDAGTADFRSAVRLSDGRIQFSFVEKDDASQVKFPERLVLGLPVFEGMAEIYKLDARLRYRVKEGELRLWWELDRPDLVLRAAYDALIEHVQTATGVHVYRGQ